MSRSTQTDASSFNYKPRRKTSLIEIEADKYFDSNRQVAEIFTQTEWSFFADKLIEPKPNEFKNYNLRNRIRK